MTNSLDTRPNRPETETNRRRPFDLSATQLVASGLAATTATFAASYLGVAGTVVGAALASVVTGIATAIYSQSLRRTRARVREVVPVVRITPRGRTVAIQPSGGQPPTDDQQRAPTPDELSRLHGAAPTGSPDHSRRADSLPWRRVALASIAVFVAVLAVVTGVEIVAGRPLSDVVRGDSGRGTSFFGDDHAPASTPAPTPGTVTQTVTPSVTVVTPTVTQTAPAVTQTQTPTVTQIPTPTPTTSSSAPAAETSAPSAAPTSP